MSGWIGWVMNYFKSTEVSIEERVNAMGAAAGRKLKDLFIGLVLYAIGAIILVGVIKYFVWVWNWSFWG